ncbi:Peptidase family M23 [Micromonospora pattaloongensis]|uniref:Peptidase family M23 n=1 Tax=Micromonospora pattaloongensis TaxID=405436 RepID=A0A1H3QS90_9ACTN|nr:M23 family metallopeptidase [Micromonospora pattaloongensis]SDZ15868.1 Peptidase family M23 [Micromonospora pattaloongensis]
MTCPTWRTRVALVSGVAVAVVAAVAPVADAGTPPLPLPIGSGPARPPVPAPAPPGPTLPLPLPRISVAPLVPPRPAEPTPAPPVGRPGTPKPPAPAPGGRPAPVLDDEGVPGTGPHPPVDPENAGEVIAGDPGADLYPEQPVDAATTPQARRVAALRDLQRRIQYLHNILTRTRDDLAALERRPDPVPRLLTALTGAEATPAPARWATAAAADTPAGHAVALSAAIASAETELTRRREEGAALERQLARRAQAALSAPAGPVTVERGHPGGRLRRPVPGPVSSSFGVRFDPYYHVWQLHAGVDFADGIGTPIVAAAAGRVSRTGWFGGYGRYTCIDHGRFDGQRLSTCYGHQSKLLVAPGQQVRAGTVIGLVGSTGASTGPHLHFEVRLGGRPVDPLPWI